MKIGITFKATGSAFASGHCQAVLALAERLKEQAYDVCLVNCGTEEWWSDMEQLKGSYRCVKEGVKGLDVLIDVDGVIGTKDIHKRVVSSSVALNNKKELEFFFK